MLGLGRDEHVDVLKGHLGAAGFRSHDGKLDLVIVESLEHFEELMATGVPLARSEESFPMSPRHVSIRRAYLRVLVCGALVTPALWRWPALLEQLSNRLL